MRQSVSVLVVSCDRYSDLWRPFFALFFKHWENCPFPVFLGSNHLNFEHPRVTTIRCGDDRSWSDGLLHFLDHIKTPYVLLTLEDFFIREPVCHQELIRTIEWTVTHNHAMVRLVPRPGPTRSAMVNELVGAVNSKDPYRVSLQATLWNVAALRALTIQGENPWQFELNATERSAASPNGFFASSKHLIPYFHHVVERGRWFPWEARRYKALNIGCDFSKRRTMSVFQTLRWLLSKTLSYPKSLIPWSWRRYIKDRYRAL